MEVWPKYNVKPEYKQLVNKALIKYKSGLDYRPYLQNYDTFGDYLNWGIYKSYRHSEKVRLDSNGLPKVKYGNEYYYNPVTVSQYTLSMHGKYVNGQNSKVAFMKGTNQLLMMQDDLGALRYPFSYNYYLKKLEKGWVSGMAQGQALSVYARAYDLTKDNSFLLAGNSVFEFLISPVSRGGTMDTMKDLHPSLDKYIIFEEYPINPASYTLNGFMFTLLGIYDWWKVTSTCNSKVSNLAGDYFKQGIKTLKHILPYYDLGEHTTYDLAHLVYGLEPKVAGYYHKVHIYLLYVLHSITGENILKHYFQLWSSYVK
ncbi:hypothetical protein J2S74_002721 [Evansella vedderi]|uniref:D-glucuronyl C5-epimerase C-terminal domain-containing protein n=1 Tax=Evansella vedderi TaxID=38282 RepID=A0ABT9ZWU8_9BACI|nr:D-glucuronyl C5-epimerase family protein [Evansella vedderi]MDQ0255339.1 hypothetical protein [Evansella vedderi]